MFRWIISYVYWKLTAALHHLFGTRLYEKKWEAKAKSIDVVMADIEHPHRLWLFEQIKSFYPFSSILEIGCGYGPNIEILSKFFPAVEVIGFDINPVAVHEGNARLSKLDLNSAHIILGKADDLSKFTDQSIDLIFTDATLLYIGPDKIRHVIAEMRRVSRKALLFVELHYSGNSRNSKGLGFHTRDGWIRDYQKILNHFFSNDSITLTKMPNDVWPTGRWPIYGHLIKVVR